MNPWVEKYRPTIFDNIVLDARNKQVLLNVINTSHFPHLLLYGPPGTGKTTTIINLINSYQTKLNCASKDLIIHLNASDERGIDIIRNQIHSFVNSKPMFRTGMKFVILDEVDYMTKSAQQALRHLLREHSSSVRFCLICNYISKIDTGLQNEFIRLRFNQLPPDEILKFLKHVCDSEKIDIDSASLINIQKIYRSDIRSMLNYMQINQHKINVIDSASWEALICKIKTTNDQKEIVDFINELGEAHCMDKKHIINDFLNYIVLNRSELVTVQLLNTFENLIHSVDLDNSTYVRCAANGFHRHFVTSSD
jgi:DNA polymerase III delta prime subunit